MLELAGRTRSVLVVVAHREGIWEMQGLSGSSGRYLGDNLGGKLGGELGGRVAGNGVSR